MTERREEVRRKTPHLSLRRKADLLGIHLSGLYYQSRPKDDEIDLMNALQDLYAKYPFMG